MFIGSIQATRGRGGRSASCPAARRSHINHDKRNRQFEAPQPTSVDGTRRLLKPRPHLQRCRSNIVERYTNSTILSTVSNVASTLLPFLATMSNEISSQIKHVQFVSTLSKGRNFTIESFDIVAGVDGA